jgi:hypothetical protein
VTNKDELAVRVGILEKKCGKKYSKKMFDIDYTII